MIDFTTRWKTKGGTDITMIMYRSKSDQAQNWARLSRREDWFPPDERAAYQHISAKLYREVRQMRGIEP